MDCAGCAKSIERAVAQLDGVETCELNFTTETLRVASKSEGIPNRVQQVVEELNFTIADADSPSKESAEKPRNFWAFMWQRLETRLALLAALLVLPGLVLTEILGQHRLWIDALSCIALALAGWPIAKSAWRSLRVSREININVLMTLAAIGALFIGAYVEAAMVMVLFAIGEALEGYTASRARHAIRSLMEVAPNIATRLRMKGQNVDGQEQVDINQLAIGDVILVRPGERIPMDGHILAGSSAVDQAPITGESRLIEKTAGDTLFAASINGQGVLEVEVTHLAADNTISRMIRMVEEAQERRAPAQRFVDQFSRFYTPAVVVLALLVATLPPLLLGQPFFNPEASDTFGWLYRGLALLVVACPCALVISTPVSIISAISNGARHGVLIKGGAYLEKLSQIKAVAFDKTGTLTQGKPAVQQVLAASCAESATHAEADWLNCTVCEDLLALAGTVEAGSEHPLAHAVVTATAEHGLNQLYPAAQNVSALTGLGITGSVADREIFVGSHAYFDAHVPHTDQQCHQATLAAQLGGTPMMVGILSDETSGEYLGTITVTDQVRESSPAVMNELKALGLESIAMLTGDGSATAQKIGAEIGVADIHADLLPQDKVSAIQKLQSAYGPVVMVGDGINDAPALATADVGIAIGGAGSTTQAMETADITLMNHDLSQLPFALKLGRATMQTIRANVIFSIGIKLAFLGLVVMGMGTMWMAVLADVGTSILVTLNGMRLLKQPK